MAYYICPVCGDALKIWDNSYKCGKGHCFDRSAKGYVNLFLSKGGSNHGDDKAMINARTDFLNKGYYGFLKDEVCKAVSDFTPQNGEVIDCGCGECYYTAAIHEALTRKNKSPEIYAVDISKDAVITGKKRCKNLNLAVASVFHLPFSKESFDTLVTMFAPFCREEYSRVLKHGAVMIMAIPLEDHLWELKRAVYETPYKNSPHDFEIEGFELVKKSDVKEMMHLSCNKDITSLFEMTPYSHKTSKEDIKKLESLDKLDVTAHFAVLVYKKI